MIQLGRLEGFYWVARTGGYARAARVFPYPITQPGVHQQIKRLEADLGLRLFERAGKAEVRLTAAGKALFDFVAPFLEGLPALEQALRAGTHGGVLRIHAAGLHLRHLLPAWIRRLHARRDDVEVVLTEVRHASADALLRGEAELLVDHLPDLPAGVSARVVGRLHSFVVLPEGHRLARRARVTPAELDGEPMVLYSDDLSARQVQLAALAAFGARPGRISSADSAEAILGFVAAGIGASLVPWPTVSGPRVAGVVAHRIRHPRSQFPVHAAWRSKGAANPLVQLALELAPAE